MMLSYIKHVQILFKCQFEYLPLQTTIWFIDLMPNADVLCKIEYLFS